MRRWIALSIVMCTLLTGMTTGVVRSFVTEISANARDHSSLSSSQSPTQPAQTDPTEASADPSVPEETVPDPTVPEETKPEETVPETIPPVEPPVEPAPEEGPAEYVLTARYAFVYDCTGETYLYTHGDQETPIPMASVTKLFTAYVALQHTTEDAQICVGSELELLDPDSSLAGFQEGQLLTVSDCLYGMLLPSGNDAAYVMAAFVGRLLLDDPEASAEASVAAFMMEVNWYAETFGLYNSHFVTPDGIDAEGHHASCADLLQIARIVLDHPILSRYVATPAITVTLISGETLTWRNTNYFLRSSSFYYVPNVIGLKTGTTDDAGCCLISAFQEDDRLLIIGVFGTPYDCARYDDTLYLYRNVQ